MAGLDLRQNKPRVFLEDVSITVQIVLKVVCILVHRRSWHSVAVKIRRFLAMLCNSILADIWGIAHLRSFYELQNFGKWLCFRHHLLM